MSGPVEVIKNRLSIVDVVGSYITLEKSGANFKAHCPFHNEKTPSFYVSPSRNSFYCFGCGAKGDIFSFVEEYEGLDFPGALKELARRAGVELEKRDSKIVEAENRLYKILEEACVYFEEELIRDTRAHQYALSRGLTQETLTRFRVGVAKSGWRNLAHALYQKGWTVDEMLRAGLVKQKDPSQAAQLESVYDVFRGRLMFPIMDIAGRVIAFTGRILEEDPKAPKYLNSPDTELYNKSSVLFAIDKAKQAIRERDRVVLVEGQMDALMSHQAGVTNTVAISGTAFTGDLVRTREEHSGSVRVIATNLGVLKRLTSNITLALDGDSAGENATLRTASIALALGFDVSVVRAPLGKDPADTIKENPHAWVQALSVPVHVILHIAAQMHSTLQEKDIPKAVATKLLPVLARVPSAVERASLAKRAAQELGLPSEALLKDLERVVVRDEKPLTREYSARIPQETLTSALARVLAYGAYVESRPALAPLKATYETKVNELYPDQSEAWADARVLKDQELFKIESEIQDETKVPTLYEEAYQMFARISQKVTRSRLLKEIQEAEKRGDIGKVKELFSLLSRIPK
jgi:DNA primase